MSEAGWRADAGWAMLRRWLPWEWPDVRVLSFLVCLLLALPTMAATGPVGLWRLDEASLEKTLDQLIAGILASASPDQREDLQDVLAEQRQDMKAQMTKSITATIEFDADGTVIFNDPESPEIHRGSWRLEGERLTVTDDDPDSPDLTGAIRGDRIELSFQVDPRDPDQSLLGSLVWVLVPAR